MKKNVLIFLCVLLGIFTLQQCSDTSTEVIREGKVQFSAAPRSSAGSATGRAAAELPSDASLLLSIETAGGTSVITQESYDLTMFNDTYLSPPISLPAGDYVLTEFMVTNADDEVVLATPIAGSTLAALVSQPLPTSFTVSADGVISLTVEVIDSAAGDAADFGYATFTPEIVDTYSFGLSVLIPADGSYEFTDATGIVFLGTDTVSYYDLDATINTLTSGNADTVYTLAVYKPGYAAYRETFTFSELSAALDGEPLMVTLEEAFTFVLKVDDTDQPEQFTMESGGELTDVVIDWGDGHTGANGALYTYSEPGLYFVSITGPLDEVYRVSNNVYDFRVVDHITFDRVPNLSEIEFLFYECPDVFDFSKNTRLLTLNMNFQPNVEDVIMPNSWIPGYITLSGNPNGVATKVVDSAITQIVNKNLKGGWMEVSSLYDTFPTETQDNILIIVTDYDWIFV